MGTNEDLKDKIIKYKGKDYILKEEKSKGYCKDCFFEEKNINGCPDSLTSFCRQGFILKQIKK